MSEEQEVPFTKPGWWKSRKFWAAVATSAAAWAVAVGTGGLTVPVAIAASSPLLAWIGIEGVVDAVGAASRK